MEIIEENGKQYRLPGGLNDFQRAIYIHLINWKWENITLEAGVHDGIEYDAILPEHLAGQLPIVYSGIHEAFNNHHKKFPFRIHKFFNHMASSQVANANLFLPILTNPKADNILRQLKPDFNRIARTELDNGFRIEFWDEPYGNLGDKTDVSGTDSDIAIAYYNHQNELCLWLIEHKLTEKEFTECGGFKSKGKTALHDCRKTFDELINNKESCYCHSAKKFKYWTITEKNKHVFPNHNSYSSCPFKGGLNQLWRNQLLGLSIENDSRQNYRQVYFAVVKHPLNKSLDGSIQEYQNLINHNNKFFAFSSDTVIKLSEEINGSELNTWLKWYRRLYNV